MDSHVQIDLGEGFDPEGMINIHQMAQFYPITHRKGKLFQKGPSSRVFPRKGLNKPGQFGIKKRKEGAEQGFP